MGSTASSRAHRLFDRLYGTAVVAAALPGERRVPYLPEEELERRRDERIRKLVAYAAETVPYYRELFAREGIDAREITTAAELERLPLTPREEVRRNPDLFISTSRLGRESVPLTTSGSTGVPVRVHHDRRTLLQAIAFGERPRHVEVRLVGKRLRYVKASLVRLAGTNVKVRQHYRAHTAIPFKPRRVHINVLQPLPDLVAEINRVRPHLLRGNGSYIGLLFRHLAETGADMHLPRAVRYGGDMLPPGVRELIVGDFGLPLISNYSATEAFHIGYTCEEGREFHLHVDLCHLMVVRRGGSKAPPGEQGEVVITNLVNRGSVLLNYRVGDVAAHSTGTCTCGRTFPLLSQLEGKTEDMLRLGDGSMVFPRLVWDFVDRYPGIARYQLVQHGPDRFELRLVADDFGRVAAPLAADLRGLLRGADVEATAHDALEPGPGGKFRPVVGLGSS